ncbi:PDZ domain-containing protein [Candidatus Woesebacteria bacterium]|nr:MAG: PDZ domain-containing protein [Candidatus Woesebacteria bacterium]
MNNGSPKLRVSIVTARKLIVVLGAISLVFFGGYWTGRRGFVASYKGSANVVINRELPVEKEDISFDLFWQVWDSLENKYYDKNKLVDEYMVYGAISGMVSALGDPYTVFLSPEQNKIISEDLNGSFEGVGIQIGYKQNQLAVIAPLVGSPAEEVGIKAGDYIIGIKDSKKGIDSSTEGMSLQEAVQVIRGDKGTSVTLTIVREGEGKPLYFDVKRSNIDVPTITVDFVGDNEKYAHIRINRFGGETTQEWEKAVSKVLINSNLSGIVLDVRNNPGGYLQAANEIASDFLEVGKVVVIEEDGKGDRTDFTVDKLGRFTNLSTVVLVNEGSASASEILAGALKDNDKAELVGEKTFGKGTIQEPEQLTGSSGLHVTIAKWLTPSGFWVNDVGLQPDHELLNDPETDIDEQLEKAIELLAIQ